MMETETITYLELRERINRFEQPKEIYVPLLGRAYSYSRNAGENLWISERYRAFIDDDEDDVFLIYDLDEDLLDHFKDPGYCVNMKGLMATEIIVLDAEKIEEAEPKDDEHIANYIPKHATGLAVNYKEWKKENETN